MTSMPSLFISHGAPDLAVQDLPASRFLRTVGQSLPRPRAIIVASAHWSTADVAVEDDDLPKTIHDFSGFDPALSAMRYEAPGDPTLAQQVVAALTNAGITAKTATRGFDHGVWVPLSLMYPGADIPVVPLSVQPRRDGQHHVAVGAALAHLRATGVLIVGSGAATHNLGELTPAATTAPEWVRAFDTWMIERATTGDVQALADWQRQGPQVRRNHPTPEHWLPLLVAMGAGDGAPGRVLHRSTTWGVLQMTMLAFGGDQEMQLGSFAG